MIFSLASLSALGLASSSVPARDVLLDQAEVLRQSGQRLAGAGQALGSSRREHRPDMSEDVDPAVEARGCRCR
jgi:uncharacterized membrane protein YccC